MALRHIGLSALVALVVAGCGIGTQVRSTFEAVGSTAPTPASTSTPTPVPLVTGSFTAPLAASGMSAIDIVATGTDANVSGEMDVSERRGRFSVELQCTRTTDTGLLLIGGDITESTHREITEGSRAAIILQPGTPVKVGIRLEVQPEAASCAAFLESIPEEGNFLQPVEGNVELGS